LSNIFKEWKAKDIHKEKLFITDGIVDKELWKESNLKVMFLLKEAYDSKNKKGSWCLSNLIKRKGVSGRTLKPIAQWAYGLERLFNTGNIETFKENGKELKQALLSSSVVNLKKSNGKKKSEKNDLLKYVEEDWELIEDQIKNINPNIIICGKTWELFHRKIKSKNVYQIESTLQVELSM